MYLVCNTRDKYALVFSAKVASSLLQAICAEIFNDKDARYTFGFFESIAALPTQTAKDVAVQLVDYRKIVITRDPFERILSAYYNKIVSPYQNFTKSKFVCYYNAVSNMQKEFLDFNGLKIFERDLDLTSKVSVDLPFCEFISFLKICKINDVSLFRDPHFETQLQVYQQIKYTKKLSAIYDWPVNFGEFIIKETPADKLKCIKLENENFGQRLIDGLEWILSPEIYNLHKNAFRNLIFNEPVRKKTNKKYIGSYCGSLKPVELNLISKNKNNGSLPGLEDMLSSEIINDINFLYEREFELFGYNNKL